MFFLWEKHDSHLYNGSAQNYERRSIKAQVFRWQNDPTWRKRCFMRSFIFVRTYLWKNWGCPLHWWRSCLVNLSLEKVYQGNIWRITNIQEIIKTQRDFIFKFIKIFYIYCWTYILWWIKVKVSSQRENQKFLRKWRKF